MEDMEIKHRSLFRDVSPCVVLVDQVGRIDYFCIGSVICQFEKTVILTQSMIVDSRVCLSVRFFDGHKQQATVLLKTEKLCVLVTNFYPKCKKVDFFEGDIDHTHAVAIAPATKSSVYNIPGFIIQKSCEVGSQVKDEAGSSSSCPSTASAERPVWSFTFSCLYGDKSANRTSRLMSGPVFNMDGKAVGIVIRDMRYKVWPKRTGRDVHSMKKARPKKHVEMGYDLKMGMSGGHLKSLLSSSFKNDDWEAGIQKAITEFISSGQVVTVSGSGNDDEKSKSNVGAAGL